MTTRTRTGTRALVAALALAGLLGACGGDDSGGTSAQAPAAGAPAPAAPEGGTEADGGRTSLGGDRDESGGAAGGSGNSAGSSGPSGPSGGDVVPGAQRRVRSAEVTVEVGNLGNAAARVRATATGLGGFVASESTGLATSATPPAYSDTESGSSVASRARPASNGESVIVLRVPEPQLEEALKRIAATGKELSRTSDAQDVTAAIADVESRVATQTRSVERVRALLGRATTLNEIVMLEGELAKREAELEAVQAGRRSLADRADLATVTAVLRTPEVAAQTLEEDGDDEGFLAGLEQGWQAVVASTTVVLTVLGALLPITVVLALIGLPVFLLRRRRRVSTP